VRLLLDTHSFVWFIEGSPRLSSRARELIEADAAEVYVSAATGWEIATKHRLRRLPTAEVLLQDGWALMESQGFQPLPVSWSHGLRAGSYSMPHRDPFDRLLAAQAELEQLILITLDPALAPFPCQTLW
jgi:PIN domain nuclease of toxin-antitoxin system